MKPYYQGTPCTMIIVLTIFISGIWWMVLMLNQFCEDLWNSTQSVDTELNTTCELLSYIILIGDYEATICFIWNFMVQNLWFLFFLLSSRQHFKVKHHYLSENIAISLKWFTQYLFLWITTWEREIESKRKKETQILRLCLQFLPAQISS